MDFTCYYDGSSLVLITPCTDAANDWVDANLPRDTPCLGNAIAVEVRYAGDVVGGIRGDGLTVAA